MSATRGWHARGGERVLWGTRPPLEAVKWRLRLCPPAEDAPAPPAVRDGPGPLLTAGRGRCALETRGISARGAWKNSGRQSRGRGLGEVAEGPCVDGCRQEAGGTSRWVNREEQNEAELSWAPRQQSLPGTGTVGLFLWLGQRSHLGCVRT